MIVKRSMRDCFLGPQLCRGVLRIQFYSSVHPSVCNAFFSGKNYYFSDFFAWSYHSVNTEKWRNPFRNKSEFWPKWDKLAGLLQILENPEKQFFFKKSLKTWKSQGNFLKNLAHGKVWEFSSEIPFNPFSIQSLSIRNSR